MVEVDAVMFSVKPENSGILFEKFLDLMSARKAAQLYNSKTRQIFTAFDVQSRGSLTFEDFRKTFNSVSPKISGRVVPAAFRNLHVRLATPERNCTIVLSNTHFHRIAQVKSAWNSSEQ
ncbi:EF-hand calcium-binding domain-containing protein 11 isoform X3 [Oxyura jamaicensis]|uniref:EF-hand calcium-binding domain-containing protein 11 isoform X3 n=1 Tax=Oxyura jamaicensis TaxID=8884 RepID=UPI0015A6036F|nr:EF-hand calcium-binding domain-containing protein 11 isoform X3 [Oxyura jamaicensis]